MVFASNAQKRLSRHRAQLHVALDEAEYDMN